MSVQRVLLASPRGYCAGVERAVDTVELALAQYGAPIYVRKQIVHNAHVVRELERQGWSADLYVTRGQDHATELVRAQLAPHHQAVWSCGGDGTDDSVWEVPPVGAVSGVVVLPAGSGTPGDSGASSSGGVGAGGLAGSPVA